MSFEHIRKLGTPEGKTAEYGFPELEGEPTLIVAPATEANKPYYNALLRKSRRKQRAMGTGKWTVALVKENRNIDRTLYAKHVVKGWRDVVNDNGDNVDFSPEACSEFLNALPWELFDPLRLFVSEADSFQDEEESPDEEELAGNSKEG